VLTQQCRSSALLGVVLGVSALTPVLGPVTGAERSGTVQHGEGKAQWHLVNLCKYLRQRGEDGARLFLLVASDRTWGNGHKLKYKKFHLNIRTPLFYFFNRSGLSV